jgi:hypothetical protein
MDRDSYLLNKFCYRLSHDPALRQLVRDDPRRAVTQWPLTEESRSRLLAGDVGWLWRRGVHPVLLVRLVSCGAFGLTQESYSAAIRRADE